MSLVDESILDAAINFDVALMSGDLARTGAALAEERGLKSAVILSLFTNRRAPDDAPLPAGVTDRQGWWGDMTASVQGDKYGSLLWLLSREKAVAAVAARAEDYARDALGWLIEDGIAESVLVEAEIQGRDRLALRITIHKPQSDAVNFRFENIWRGVADTTGGANNAL